MRVPVVGLPVRPGALGVVPNGTSPVGWGRPAGGGFLHLGRGRFGAPRHGGAPAEGRWLVALLMAEGRSNGANAGRLFVNAGTVEKHVSNIFARLGLEETGTDHRRVLAVVGYVRG